MKLLHYFAAFPLVVAATYTHIAQADENYFGYVYGSDTLPAGASEAYLWVTDRRNKGQGIYHAQDYALEVEHGFTDKLQGSVYLTASKYHIKDAAPIEDGVPEYPNKQNFGLNGVKVSLKYNLLSVYKDAFGLSFYVEPGWSSRFKVTGQDMSQYSLEMKLIAQKNFFDDTLVWATNLTTEFERRKVSSPGESWGNEMELEVTTGLSYRFAPKWFAGVEGRYHSEYPDWNNHFKREHYAVFFGPNIHYGGEKFWWTATYLPQMYGGPRDLSRDETLHLGEHERRELRFKLGYNF